MAKVPGRGADLAAWKRYVTHRLVAGSSELEDGTRVSLDIEPTVLEELATLLEQEYQDLVAIAGEEGSVREGSAREISDSEIEELIERRVGSWSDLQAALATGRYHRGLRPKTSPGSDATSATTGITESIRPSFYGLWLDLKAAARSLTRAPGLSFVAVVVLALGIGATTGIFSLLDAVLLEPLPYHEPQRLGIVQVEAFSSSNVPLITDSNVIDFTEGANTLQGIETFDSMKLMLDSAQGSRLVTATTTTPGMLQLLGVEIPHGRGFREAGDTLETGSGNVLLSAGLWKEHFRADTDVVGSTIQISEQPVQVLGILPPGLRLLVSPGVRERSDLWMVRARPTERAILFRRQAIVRLADGVTFEQASSELNVLAERGKELDFNLQQEGSARYEVVPLEDHLRRDVRPALLGVFFAGATLLLLVCANIAHLLLLRSLHRKSDWALRRALGASRWRLTSHSLAESFLLATTGGALGLCFAWLLRKTIPLLPGLELPRLESVRIDSEVLLFCVATTFLTAILSGFAPALAAHRDRGNWLREKTTLGGMSRSRLGGTLVAGQVAITLVLLATCGALLGSLKNLYEVPLGFTPEEVLAFDFSLNRELRQDPEKRLRFNRELIDWLESRPEVQSASLSNTLPFTGRQNLASYATDKASEATFGDQTGSFHRVLPRYFETMGIKLLAGVDFTDADTDNEAHVCVINESLARSAWPDQSALGQSVLIEFRVRNGTERRPAKVIGVVANIKETDLSAAELPQIYLPYWPTSYAQDFVVRASVQPLTLAKIIDAELERRGDGLIIDDAEPLAETTWKATTETRLAVVLLGAFGLLALIVSSLGLYGSLSYGVGKRSGEIGLRMALGATERNVLLRAMCEGLALAGVGALAGLLASFWALRLLSGFLFEVGASDLRVLLGALLILSTAASLACLVPARRATKITPVEALRSE